MHRSLRAALLRRRRPAVAGAARPRPVRGDGYEFTELRAYVEGDDPRRIDWAATARAGALQSRIMHEEHGLFLAAVLDGSGSMHVGRERVLYEDAFAAARAWFELAEDTDRCARIVDGRLVTPRERRGPLAARACLAGADRARLPFVTQLTTARALIPPDASLLLVSDFFELDAIAGELSALGRRCDCTALVVRDPWLPQLPLGGFVRLRDAESGQTRRVFIGARQRQRYAEAVVQREEAVRDRLRRHGMRSAVLAGNAHEALRHALTAG